MPVNELANKTLMGIPWGSRMWKRLFYVLGDGTEHKLPMGEDIKKVFMDDGSTVIFYLVPQIPYKRNHRVFVQCDCGKFVPAGRVKQHKCHSK